MRVSAARPTPRWAVMFLLALGMTPGGQDVRAAGAQSDGAQSSVAVASAQAKGQDDNGPSVELLEFLGSFATADGHWLDPMALASPATGGAVSSRGDRGANAQTSDSQDMSQIQRASEGHDQHD